jgi:hypothetical protein
MRHIARNVAAYAVLMALMAGCDGGRPSAAPSPDGPGSYGPDVVHYDGVHELRFGDSERALTERGVVVRDVPECGPRMAKPTGASPVFVAGRLALVWADPPLHTPEQVAVGDSVAEARKAYPAATELAAPAGTYRFSGLLVTRGDRAYLFLHDGREVQKLIVGYARHARTLFAQGFAGC